MNLTLKIALGTCLGITLAFGGYKAVVAIVTGVQKQGQMDAWLWAHDITPEKLSVACGKPARDIAWDDEFYVAHEVMYVGGWTFYFGGSNPKWIPGSPKPSLYFAYPTLETTKEELAKATIDNGDMDPKYIKSVLQGFNLTDINPSDRSSLLAAMPCLAKLPE